MKKALLLAMLFYAPEACAGQIITECVITGKNIIQYGRSIGRYNGKYIVKLPELRGVGRRDGKYIVRLSDKKEACRQDGEEVINVRTGKSIGKGEAAAVCLCADLLY